MQQAMYAARPLAACLSSMHPYAVGAGDSQRVQARQQQVDAPTASAVTVSVNVAAGGVGRHRAADVS